MNRIVGFVRHAEERSWLSGGDRLQKAFRPLLRSRHPLSCNQQPKENRTNATALNAAQRYFSPLFSDWTVASQVAVSG